MPESLAKQYQEFTEAKHSAFKLLQWEPQFTSLEQGIQSYVSKYLLRNLGA
jgi:hypothetical protein